MPVDLANQNSPWRAAQERPLQNWLISDPLYQYYPLLAHNVAVIRDEHAWPLWDSDILTGHPSFADPLYQTFYPVFTALGLVLGPARALSIGLWLHVLLAALLTYGLLRRLACTPGAAVIGALVYALGGYMVTWFETPFWVSTLAWLPGILWAFECSLRRHSLASIALGSVALALAILGGQLSFVVVFLIMLSLYAIARCLERARDRGSVDLWPFLSLFVMVLVGALLSAIQIVPFTELLTLSRRQLAQLAFDPLSVKQLVTLVLPDVLGNPSLPSAYWGEGNYSEYVLYFGLVPLLLVILSVLNLRRARTAGMAIITLAMMLLILGCPGVSLLGRIPVLRYISLHRSVFILPLCFAILSARVLSLERLPGTLIWLAIALVAGGMALGSYAQAESITQHWATLRAGLVRQVVILVIGGALVVFHNRRASRGLVEAGLVVVVFADLFLAGNHYNPSGPVAELLNPTPAVTVYQDSCLPERAVALQQKEILFGPNILSVFGIPEGDGYSSFILRRYYALVAAGDPQIDIGWASRESNMVLLSHPSERLLDLLGVRYLFTNKPLTDAGIVAEHLVEATEADSGEITPQSPLSGTFVVQSSALNRLDLCFRVYHPDQVKGALVFHLWRETDPLPLVVEETIPATDLADGQVLTLYFEPEREACGQRYRWELAASPETSHSGVGLYVSASGEPAVSAYGAQWATIYSGETQIIERLVALPHAYVVYAAETSTDDGLATERLLSDDLDLRYTAVVPDAVSLPSAAAVPATAARVVEATSTSVTISAHAEQAGLLVLSDQYYPGWKVYVDGEPEEIIRANQISRGVLLSPGEHAIVFRFEPQSLRIGGWLSLAGLVLLAGLLVMPPLLARRRQS